MTFTDWEIDAMRRALNAYRIATARDGRLTSWRSVAHNILMSDVTYHEYPIDGEEPAFQDEALRRFANGTSTLQADKMEDLRSFLHHEKFLRDDDLQDEPREFSDILAIVSYLANDSEQAAIALSRIGTKYRSEIGGSASAQTYILRLGVDHSRNVFRVEEETERRLGDTNVVPSRSQSQSQSRKDNEWTTREIRKGYGCASTQSNVLHAFLRGAAPDDRITYLQVILMSRPTNMSSLHLVRSGPGVAPSGRGRGRRYNIHEFVRGDDSPDE